MALQFYTAGKVKHAEKFRKLRDDLLLPVCASWIDLPSVFDIKTVWPTCYEDVRHSNFVLLYCETFEEELRGALVEIGMAFGMNKPVYAINTCKSLKVDAVSDVAFTHYKLWNWLESKTLHRGALEAMALYIKQRKGN